MANAPGLVKSVLIAGACGFLGSSAALWLRERFSDLEIVGIDNLSRRGSETNLARLAAAGVRVVHGDVRSASDVDALPDTEWTLDMAAMSSVTAGVDSRTTPRQLLEHNQWGSVNLLERARRGGSGLVLVSTSRVYSIPVLASLELEVRDDAFVPIESQQFPAGISRAGIGEGTSTAAPASLYGATKLASEVLALEYGAAFGFPVIVNRCGLLAGAQQFGTPDQGIISYWIRAYASRQPLEYIGFGGSGHQVRDVLHPADLLELLLRQVRRPEASAGRVWNAGGGVDRAVSLKQLSRWCAQEFGARGIESSNAIRPFDVPWVVMDSRRARDAFEWAPRVQLRELFEEIAAHHRANPHWLRLSRAA